MPLSDVLHQESAQDRLQRSLRQDRVPHAYLFTGPHGVGKEMLAHRLAAILLCESPIDVSAASGGGAWLDACGTCTDCTLLAAGNHPDFHRIHKRLNKVHEEKRVRDQKGISLGIEVIRSFLINQIGRRPSRGRAKVYIIEEYDRLTDAAQNAMLKTLEEPPGHSYLILLTSSPDALLATTKSRCQQVQFRPLPSEFVTSQLVARCGISREAASFVAEFVQGRLGDALQCVAAGVPGRIENVLKAMQTSVDNPLACSKIVQDLGTELGKAFAKALEPIAEEEDEAEESEMVEADDDEEPAAKPEKKVEAGSARQGQLAAMGMIATALRDVQRVAAGHTAAALPGNAIIRRLAEGTRPGSVAEAIRAVSSAEYHLERSVNNQLAFDTMSIALGRGLSAAVGI